MQISQVRIIVAGGRDFSDYAKLENEVIERISSYRICDDIMIISGH